MSSHHDRPERPKTSRRRRRRAAPANVYKKTVRAPDDETEGAEARAHFHREKARRAERVRAHDHPLEQARRAYHALLASAAETAKGGRPRKNAARKGVNAADEE